MKRAGPDVVLVAHSLAYLVVAHWAAAKPHSPIKAALLVAVPNSKVLRRHVVSPRPPLNPSRFGA